MEAVMGLKDLRVGDFIDATATTSDSNATSSLSAQVLLQSPPAPSSDYSTAVIRSHSPHASHKVPPSLSSILTIRPFPLPNDSTPLPVPSAPLLTQTTLTEIYNAESLLSIETYHTTRSSMVPSIAAATEGGSTIRSLPMVHRFTLIRPGTKKPAPTTNNGGTASPTRSNESGWNPLDLFFSSALLVAKCDICTKRLGWKPVLECDDCGLRTHVKCGEVAPKDCGIRPIRLGIPQSPSPLSKVNQNAKSASLSPRR